MKAKNFNIQSIKIENFKSYRKPSIFFTNEIKCCILGKNGVGKTTISDALVFVFGGTLKDINCTSIESLFPDFFLNKNYIMSKIGILIIYNSIFMEIFRTIDITGVNEFYLNGNIISFFHFKSIIENINIKYFKDIIILKNLPTNSIFLNNQKLITIIEFMSNSHKLTKFHLKINLLKNKLIENYFFYFQKIKFILVEKNLIQNEKYEVYKINNIKQNISNKKLFCFFLKKILLLHQYFKLENIFKKILYQIRELNLKKNLLVYSINKSFNQRKKICNNQKKIKKILMNFNFSNNNIKQNEIFFSDLKYYYFNLYFSNLIKFFYFNLKKKLGCNFKLLQFSVPNLSYFYCNLYEEFYKNNIKFFPFFEKSRIKTDKFQFKIKYIQYFSEKIFYFSFMLSNSNSFTIFFFFYLNKIFIISFLLKLNYEKIIKNTFFCTISFIITLIYIKEKNILHQKELAINDNFFLKKKKGKQYEIRGLISNMYKPLDSQHKLLFKFLTDKNYNIIIVDNLKIALKCIEIIKKKKLSKIEFLCKNQLKKIEEFDIYKYLREYHIILKYLEFDQYDLRFFIYLIKKKLSSKKTALLLDLLNFRNSTNINNVEINIIENLKYETMTFLPQNYKKKNQKIDEKIVLKKKSVLIQVLNQKIKFSVKEKVFYKIICQNLNNFFKFFLINFQKNFKKSTFFFSLNFGITSWNCCFLNFFKFFYKSFHFQLMLYYSKKNRYKFKNLKRKYNLNLIKKISNLIFITQKKIKRFNLIDFISNHVKIPIVNLYFYQIFVLNNFLIVELVKYFKNFFKKIDVKLKKILTYLEKINRLLKKNFCSFTQIFGLIFTKKAILTIIKKKRFQIFIDIKFLFIKNKPFFIKTHFIRLFLWELIINKIRKKCNIDCSLFFLRQFSYLLLNKIIIKIHKIFNKNLKIKKIDKKKLNLLTKRLEFIEKRFIFLKKKLIKNKYQRILIDIKLNKTKKKLNKKFEFFFQIISENVNLIYREITQTLSNPFGGTAFLNFVVNKFTKLKKIIYTAIPSSRKNYDLKNLSGGEKTIASFALLIALNSVYKPPIIFADEIDFNLDNWHSEKITKFLIKWSEKTKVKLYIITLKIKLILLFQNIIFIYKNTKGSDFYNLIF
jgi:hypothetical protein